jgi:hypothetical protein
MTEEGLARLRPPDVLIAFNDVPADIEPGHAIHIDFPLAKYFSLGTAGRYKILVAMEPETFRGAVRHSVQDVPNQRFTATELLFSREFLVANPVQLEVCQPKAKGESGKLRVELEPSEPKK